jgi:hypothetical protein
MLIALMKETEQRAVFAHPSTLIPRSSAPERLSDCPHIFPYGAYSQ